jgi:hypothetical protein
MKATFGMLGLAAIAVTTTASAQTPKPPVEIPTRVTGAVFSAACERNKDVCVAYVLGTADAFSTTSAALGQRPVFCPAPAVTNEQMAQSAVNFVRAHPELAKANAADAVLAALIGAYPCAK